MKINTMAYNRSTWIKENITIEGSTLQEIGMNAFNNGYEVDRVVILEALLNKKFDESYDIVLKNSQFVYFAPIEEVLNKLRNNKMSPDSLCNYLDKYDRQYPK